MEGGRPKTADGRPKTGYGRRPRIRSVDDDSSDSDLDTLTLDLDEVSLNFDSSPRRKGMLEETKLGMGRKFNDQSRAGRVSGDTQSLRRTSSDRQVPRDPYSRPVPQPTYSQALSPRAVAGMSSTGLGPDSAPVSSLSSLKRSDGKTNSDLVRSVFGLRADSDAVAAQVVTKYRNRASAKMKTKSVDSGHAEDDQDEYMSLVTPGSRLAPLDSKHRRRNTIHGQHGSRRDAADESGQTGRPRRRHSNATSEVIQGQFIATERREEDDLSVHLHNNESRPSETDKSIHHAGETEEVCRHKGVDKNWSEMDKHCMPIPQMRERVAFSGYCKLQPISGNTKHGGQ